MLDFLNIEANEENNVSTCVINLCNQAVTDQDFSKFDLIFVITDSLDEDRINAVKSIKAKTEALIISMCVGMFEVAAVEKIEEVSEAITIAADEAQKCDECIEKIVAMLNQPAMINLDYSDLKMALSGERHFLWSSSLPKSEIKEKVKSELLTKWWVESLKDSLDGQILMIITGNPSLQDVAEISDLISKDYFGDIVLGVSYDGLEEDEISVLVIYSL